MKKLLKATLYIFCGLMVFANVAGCAGTQQVPPVQPVAEAVIETMPEISEKAVKDVAGPVTLASTAVGTGTFCENTDCGVSHKIDSSNWQWKYRNTTGLGYGFFYEVMDKTQKGKGFKVKTGAIVKDEKGNHWVIYLDCERYLDDEVACSEWLLSRGYGLDSDGAEDGGPSGNHLTTRRGAIYRIPNDLYTVAAVG